MDNTTKSRIDQIQLRDSSRLVVLRVCKSEDLSENGVEFTCPFVLIVFANMNNHYIVLFAFIYPVREERMHKKIVLSQAVSSRLIKSLLSIF